MKFGLIESCVLSMVLFIGGCAGNKTTSGGNPIKNPTPSKDVSVSIEKQTTEIQKIEEANKDTIAVTDKLVSNNPSPEISQGLSQIKENSNKIENSTEIVKTETKTLTTLVEQVKTLENQVVKLQSDLTKARAEMEEVRQNAIKNIYSSLNYFFALGFLVILAGGVVGFMVNPRLGMLIAGIGLIGIGLAAGAIFYLKTIAVVGVGIILGSIVLALFLGIRYLLVTHKAATENVKFVEKIKDELTPDQKETIFGPEKAPVPLFQEVQSPVTQKLVQEIRKKL